MSDTALHPRDCVAEHAPTRRSGAKTVYRALLRESDSSGGDIDELARAASRAFLNERLAAASRLPADLPDDPRSLAAWLEDSSAQAGREYHAYLEERRAGAPRRYFTTKSHALYFLKAVAPTKLVDGAWLFGLLRQWRDPRFEPLIRIYLEELGDGEPEKNHVALYRKLVAAHGCDTSDGLGETFFTQGAIQLALAHHAADFLPETIGFNLGYEQLPLHLLITAYELAELGIDPYYFTLHVTVDNASTGHARKSLEAVMQLMPRGAGAEAFYRRLANGLKLNSLGAGAREAIESFDLERELLGVLARKAPYGAQLHSDYCRFAGKTVNEWLGEPGSVPAFLQALESAGWIKRGRDPRESRFWQMLEGDRAPMFGVFNGYEQQLIHDWIAQPVGDGPAEADAQGTPPRIRRFAARRPAQGRDPTAPVAAAARPTESVAGLIERHFAAEKLDASGDFDSESRGLKQELLEASGPAELMGALVRWMSPARHHLPTGLLATRVFTSLLPRLA